MKFIIEAASLEELKFQLNVNEGLVADIDEYLKTGLEWCESEPDGELAFEVDMGKRSCFGRLQEALDELGITIYCEED